MVRASWKLGSEVAGSEQPRTARSRSSLRVCAWRRRKKSALLLRREPRSRRSAARPAHGGPAALPDLPELKTEAGRGRAPLKALGAAPPGVTLRTCPSAKSRFSPRLPCRLRMAAAWRQRNSAALRASACLLKGYMELDLRQRGKMWQRIRLGSGYSWASSRPGARTPPHAETELLGR